MSMVTITTRALAVIALAGLLAACMNQPPEPRHPGPYNDPVDAFDAVDTPYDPNSASGPGHPLTDDIAHLRDAREAYEHSQAVQAARLRDQQKRCRNTPGAKLVHIHDGSDDPDAVYCQMPAGSNGQGQPVQGSNQNSSQGGASSDRQ